jgi:hypothetical protein
MIEGQNFPGAATIFALSDGVYSGWRIDLLFPSNRLVFQIARGKLESPVGVVSSIRIPPKTWSYIAVSRDEEKIRIFVNGLLAGQVKHNATPTCLTPGTSLKIGYAGNGLSSAILQIEELSIFSNSLSAAYILSESLQIPRSPDFSIDLLEKASLAFVAREYEDSLISINTLIESIAAESPFIFTLQYRIAEIYRHLKKDKIATEIFRSLAENTDTPTAIRHLALHDYLSLQEGVNFLSDSMISNYTHSFFANYPELAPCSERYSNALQEYDFAIPLKQTKNLYLQEQN